MIPSTEVVDLSRLQFGITALFHFLFVPLTLGLSWLLVIMEAMYLKTGNVIYKDMTRFWGKLFAINFAMGIVTGITLEFEFGQNWAYFSRFIGDAFGPALAIEGITAFMLEATMIGLFLFGWNRMSKKKHFMATTLLAIGSNISVIMILVANSWMQHPVGSTFDFATMHVKLASLGTVFISELAQVRIGHIILASCSLASMFVLGISCFYLLKNRDTEFAKRSIAAAVGFGMIAVLGVAAFGDANGLEIVKHEPMKMAAMEGEFTTAKEMPVGWKLGAIINQKEGTSKSIVTLPAALSLVATHSLNETVAGIDDIVASNVDRIKDGSKLYVELYNYRKAQASANKALAAKELNKLNGLSAELRTKYKNKDKVNIFSRATKNVTPTETMETYVIGYGFMLHNYYLRTLKDPSQENIIAAMSNPSQKAIDAVAKKTVPPVAVTFWSFRAMIFIWGAMFLIIFLGFFYTARRTIDKHPLFQRLALYAIPLPWLAAEFGWVVAEVGRQPWVIHGVMPTSTGVSSLNASTVGFSLGGFIIFYSLLFIVEIFLMFKYARLGPSSLGEGRYHHELKNKELGQ